MRGLGNGSESRTSPRRVRASSPRSFESEQYVAIFENSMDGVLLTVPDGQVLAANPAACQLLGRSEKEICTIGRQGLSDPTDPRWASAVAERARTGRTRTQARMLRADGTSFEVDFSSAVFTAADGQRRSVVIFRDLSERLALARELALLDDRDRIAGNLHRTVMRRASAASMLAHGLLTLVPDKAARSRIEDLVSDLEKMVVEVREAIYRLSSAGERRYQTLVENSPVAVAVYRERDAKFVYANQSAVDLYGARDLDDMLSHYAPEVIPGDMMIGWQQGVARIVNGAGIRHGRLRLVRFDGDEINVEINAATVVFDSEPCIQVELHEVGGVLNDQPSAR